MRKDILVIVDGMEDEIDVGIDELKALNRMTSTKTNFVPPGYLPDSLTCILTLLGSSFIPSGRAYIELLGRGIPLNKGFTALRVTAVGVDDAGCIYMLYSAQGRMATENIIKHGVPLIPAQSYKSFLIAKGGGRIKTFEPHAHIGKPLEELLPAGLDGLPEQMLAMPKLTGGYSFVPWSPSIREDIPKCGREGSAVVCGCDIMKGIAIALGCDLLDAPNATGDVDTDLKQKCKLALECEQERVIVHINGADEAAHRRKPEQKRAFLRRVDEQLLLPLLNSGAKLEVCSDHGTGSVTGGHMGGKVRVWKN